MILMGTATIPFGYSLSIIGANFEVLEAKFKLSESEARTWVSLLSSINSVGAVVGVFSTSAIMNYGRRPAVIIMDTVGVLGALLTLIENLYCIALGRFIVGFSFLGMSTVLAPKYIEESSPLEYKGSLGSLTQIFIITGAFIATTLGFGVPTEESKYQESEYWRVMFGVQGVFGIFHLILFLVFFNYDTPKYL